MHYMVVRCSCFTSSDPVPGVNVYNSPNQITASVSLLPQEIHGFPRFLLLNKQIVCWIRILKGCHYL